MKSVKKKLSLLLVLVLLVNMLLPMSALAAEANNNVLVPAERVVEDDYFAAGNTVTVKGRITGDLFAAGNNLAAQGELGGDLLVAGRRVDVGGRVRGSVRAAGESISLQGQVGRSATIACRELTVAPGAALGGNVLAAAETIRCDGKVAGNLRAVADTILIAGEVGRNVEVEADRVVVLPGARVRGSLTYRSANPAEIHEGARVEGDVKRIPVTPVPEETLGGKALQEVLRWLALLAVALVFVFFLPKATSRVAGVVRTRPWVSLGLGVCGLLVPPFLAVLLFASVVGVALGWVVLAGYAAFLAAGILLGKVFLGFLVGVLILQAIRKREDVSPLWSVLLGATLLKALVFIPYLGWLVDIAVVLLTLGALLCLAGQSWLGRRVQPAPLLPEPAEGP